MVLRALHLCSGYAGMELGLRLAGVPARSVAHVERDSHAAATLVARMEDKALDQAPVWSDLAAFDPGPWRGRVDLVTAGLPCQPFSSAGLKAGADDERHLWPLAERVIAGVGPRFVFLENVPAVLQLRFRWLERVLCDLAALGTVTAKSGEGYGLVLTEAVAPWATPVARDDNKSPEAHLAMKARMGGNRTEATSLTVQAKMWLKDVAASLHSGHPDATTTTDGGNGSPKADLNPQFVEALMGVPRGWLNPCISVGTDSFRSWLHMHLSSSPAAPESS